MSSLNHRPRPGEGEPTAIHVLMSGLIDYAGLFPPAKLAMAPAVQNYARYLASPEAWMLGRFVLPVSRLEEFRNAALPMLPRSADPSTRGGGEPWPISAIIDGDIDENLDSIFAFNHEHERPENGLAVIDAIELKPPPTAAPGATGPTGAAWIDDALELIPEELYPFFEIPIMPSGPGAAPPDFRGMIAALAGADAGAKVRTGGITPGSIPPLAAVAEFIVACCYAEVPFKATAGLHHACRGRYPLTYEPGSEAAIMHGFLNVFLGAAFAQSRRLDADRLREALEESDSAAFGFGRDVVTWRALGLDCVQLAHTRETFALSYGSCSFEEPVQELRALGLI
ncbi:MAG: hypothetical protein KF699_02390 [Phycisphaeraceae bacterium]|nr:hypothetical protein [Phycisphaeraceae bacterium]